MLKIVALRVAAGASVVLAVACEAPNDGSVGSGGGGPVASDTGARQPAAPGSFVAEPEVLWSKHFGQDGRGAGTAVAVDASDDVLVTGTFGHAIDFGSGSLTSTYGSVYVVKFDPTGKVVWTRTFAEGPLPANPNGIAVDGAGDAIVAGTFTGELTVGDRTLFAESDSSTEAFVIELDASGRLQWVQHFAADSIQIGGLAADLAGNIAVAGAFSGSATFGATTLSAEGGADIFVARLGRRGEDLWARALGGPRNDLARAVAIASNDRIAVSGFVDGYLSGVEHPAVVNTAFAALLDSAGDPVYFVRGVEDGTSSGQSVAFDPAGRVLVSGTGGGLFSASTSTGLFAAELDDSGGQVWSTSFSAGPKPGTSTARSLAVESSGDVLMTGVLGGSVNFGTGPLTPSGENDAFVAKLTDDARYVWARHFGGVDSDDRAEGLGVAAGRTGVYVIGSFEGSMDLDAATGAEEIASDDDEGFLVKLAP